MVVREKIDNSKCSVCGYTGKLYFINHEPWCRKCLCDNFIYYEPNIAEEGDNLEKTDKS